MRIISGRLKGRRIKMFRGIRPTQGKVRKALFDILGDIKGLSFLELYAGSGAVGLEALSQGASKVVFVEKDRICIKRIKESLSGLGLIDQQVIGLEANEALKRLNKRGEKLDIIFLDPPYYRDIAKKTLKMLNRYDIVAPNGLIICQHFKKDILPEIVDNLRLFKQASYGDTVLSFYKKG
jgi:16S rRNA (guanine(966)-N(2))-methyltransferase RsmD